VGWAKVDEKDLILVIVDLGRQVGAKDSQFARVALAEEDGELGMIAAAFEEIEDFASPLVVGDVIGDEKMPAGGHRVVTPV
jgi:hypothetical protein